MMGFQNQGIYSIPLLNGLLRSILATLEVLMQSNFGALPDVIGVSIYPACIILTENFLLEHLEISPSENTLSPDFAAP